MPPSYLHIYLHVRENMQKWTHAYDMLTHRHIYTNIPTTAFLDLEHSGRQQTAGRQADRQASRQAGMQAGSQAGSHTHRYAGRQASMHTGRQAGRQGAQLMIVVYFAWRHLWKLLTVQHCQLRSERLTTRSLTGRARTRVARHTERS